MMNASMRREVVCKLAQAASVEAWERITNARPSVLDERWRIREKCGRWVVRYEPLNHPQCWKDIASFATETEAIVYVQHI